MVIKEQINAECELEYHTGIVPANYRFELCVIVCLP